MVIYYNFTTVTLIFTAASLLPHLSLNFDLILVKTEACWKLILCLLGLVYFQRVIYNT